MLQTLCLFVPQLEKNYATVIAEDDTELFDRIVVENLQVAKRREKHRLDAEFKVYSSMVCCRPT